MIYQFGMSNKGFTLLEVVVATLILAISLTAILKIFTNYLTDYDFSKNEIEDIQQVKRYIYDIKEEDRDIPSVEVKSEGYKYGVVKKVYLYKEKPILFDYVQ
ncbi:prepilin-type N-terminal cleavage/methylation domain-containing protein [Hydrogenothermus marinus]|uniref:Prepilin-type N-terminal cleavage/methylation domain-containing protein n=2 Tax=Hydrogenothermus marinus TaxID=133270 RepID=A0A3M0BDY1_9AQUI|nr:prepilin-type N-terminal cleavage/methylation domain-containing protein [Hydrogenothermus marinus]